jgi:hypothetical protein
MKKPCRALQRIARYSFEGEEHTAAAALVSNPSYSPHSRDSLTGMVQPPGIA